MPSEKLTEILKILSANFIEIKNELNKVKVKETFYFRLAQILKEVLDEKKLSEDLWQVIVGDSFGSFFTFEKDFYVHCQIEEVYITIWVSP